MSRGHDGFGTEQVPGSFPLNFLTPDILGHSRLITRPRLELRVANQYLWTFT